MTRLSKTLYHGIGVILLGVALVVMFNVGLDLKRFMRVKPVARREMKQLLSRTNIGQSQTRFQQIFRAGKFVTLKLHRVRPDYWVVTTPYEFGANNWHLHIEFNADSQIGALRIRTNDSVYEKPKDNAPADKVSPLWRHPLPRKP